MHTHAWRTHSENLHLISQIPNALLMLLHALADFLVREPIGRLDGLEVALDEGELGRRMDRRYEAEARSAGDGAAAQHAYQWVGDVDAREPRRRLRVIEKVVAAIGQNYVSFLQILNRNVEKFFCLLV